jgi:3-hydroxyacyl-CoA dehydrogenase
MFHADQVGLDRVLGRVREFARNPHGDPAAWKPAPLLERLTEAGGTFADWTLPARDQNASHAKA